MRKYIFILIPVVAAISIIACRKDPDRQNGLPDSATPANVDIPDHFPPMLPAEGNPMTEEAIELGRNLFWEKRMSGDNTMSCGTCHAPKNAFGDDTPTSEGIDGNTGTRNAMALANLAWQENFFWDARTETLEEQIIEPVPNPVEMHQSWANAISKLENSEEPDYQQMFKNAFGEPGIDSIKAAKSVAQFLRTMISSNAPFDAYYKYQNGYSLNASEQTKVDNMSSDAKDGYAIFMGEEGDCFHCHGGALTFKNQITNNGLDFNFSDIGYQEVTGNPADAGTFKVPSLRNIELSGPYMHDGRFNSLVEVLQHYSGMVKETQTLDPIFVSKHIPDDGTNVGGVDLSTDQIVDLREFLKTLTDEEFINDPKFSDPFE